MYLAKMKFLMLLLCQKIKFNPYQQNWLVSLKSNFFCDFIDDFVNLIFNSQKTEII